MIEIALPLNLISARTATIIVGHNGSDANARARTRRNRGKRDHSRCEWGKSGAEL